MQASSTYATAARRQARRAGSALLCVAVISILAAIPASRAQASASTSMPSIQLPATIAALPEAQLETLLAQLPLSDLSATELGKSLAMLPALSSLPTSKLEQSIAAAVTQLAGGGKKLGALTNPAEVVSTIVTELTSRLNLLELTNLKSLLGLKGGSITSVLTGGLGSLTPSQVVGALLASAGEPQQVLASVLGGLNVKGLETLLGSAPPTEPLVPGTVGGLASQLGISSETLASDLGKSALELPPTALALTGALTNGKTLGALNGLGGLSLSLLTPASKESEGGNEGGSGGTGGSSGGGSSTTSTGGQGASGGGTQGGTGSGTTVVVELAQTPSAAAAAAAAAGAAGALKKVRIVSHTVKGGVATLVVEVPSAGRLTLAGHGLRTTSHRLAHAGRVTIRVRLANAKPARHRARRRANVKLTASFAPSNAGPNSSASVTVGYMR